MSSCYSENKNIPQAEYMLFREHLNQKRKKDYICPCGRPYGSYPALYAHIKKKHDGKAPGQLIKPKPIRRRGRPVKHQPINLKTENPHHSASKHVQNYLNKTQNCFDYPVKASNAREKNLYPLKQYANPNFEASFLNFQTNLQYTPRRKYAGKYGIQENQNLGGASEGSWDQFFMRQKRNEFAQNQSPPQEGQFNLFGMTKRLSEPEGLKIFPSYERSEDYQSGSNENFNVGREHIQNYKHFDKDNRSLKNHVHTTTEPNKQPSQNTFVNRGYDDSFDALYLKPFQILLREEMQAKFKPISQGIIEFLEPILKQLLEQEQTPNSQKPIIEHNLQQKLQEEVSQQNDHKLKEKSLEDLSKIQHKQNQQDRAQITVQALFERKQFREILKWLMTPPQQISSHRKKENYIEFSFRCCLVEFLDFLYKFLETVQYEQVLLVLVFLCNHILEETESFQIQPEPQIYEMGLYYNSFINEYLPKLVKFTPYLQKFYIFKDFKKKTSELLMWMSSWQAIQQYYHNKFYRKKIIYEIEQENNQCLLYQKNYQSYMREAMKANNSGTTDRINNQAYQINSNERTGQKVEQNPEMIIVNAQQNLQSQQQLNLTQKEKIDSSPNSQAGKNNPGASNSADGSNSTPEKSHKSHDSPESYLNEKEIESSDEQDSHLQNSESFQSRSKEESSIKQN